MLSDIRKVTPRGTWTIIYEAKSGIISKRTIYVHKLEDRKITAYCYLRRQVRCFHTERILAAERKCIRKGGAR